MSLSVERAVFNKRLEAAENAKPKGQKILQVFSQISMRKGHPGLGEIAKKAGHDPGDLKLGEYVLFVNTARTALKIFAANNVVAHFKMPEHAGKLDMRTISLIPRCFNGAKFDYDKAIKEVIATALTPK